jgi:hypothetical protein
MQPLVVWLVARPQNAVLALAASVSLAYVGLLSGVIMVLLVLEKGWQRAALYGLLAALLLAAIGLITKAPLMSILSGAVSLWLPALLLAAGLQGVRSLTLLLQLSVVIAVVALCAVFLVYGNPVEYWIAEIDRWAEAFRAADGDEIALWLEAQKPFAGQLTMLFVYANWFVQTVCLVLGYKLYRVLPDKGPEFGRFRDLNLGRVLGSTLIVVSVLWMVTDSVWLQSVAFVLFGAFWLQGLAMVHWLYGESMLPKFGIVLSYVMLLSFVLSAVTTIGLAVFGYLDAWFRLRRQPKITG